MMRGVSRASQLALLVMLASCGASERAERDAGVSPTDRPAPAAALGGRVVSTVDGASITIDEVEEVVRETGLSPLDALRRLQEERVLSARAAIASGGAGDDGVEDGEVEDGEVADGEAERAARRAAVRALLSARVEAEIGPASVPAELLARAYEEQRARFQRPERRRATHVLAQLPPGAPPEAIAAAERFARRAIAQMSASADPAAEAHAIEAEGITGRTFRVVVEDLPLATRRDPLEEPFLAALFALESPGVVPAPVRTSFGLHAIALVEIAPPWEAPREEAEATLRSDVVAMLRAQRLEQLIEELTARTTIARDEAAIERLLSTDLEGANAP